MQNECLFYWWKQAQTIKNHLDLILYKSVSSGEITRLFSFNAGFQDSSRQVLLVQIYGASDGAGPGAYGGRTRLYHF